MSFFTPLFTPTQKIFLAKCLFFSGNQQQWNPLAAFYMMQTEGYFQIGLKYTDVMIFVKMM